MRHWIFAGLFSLVSSHSALRAQDGMWLYGGPEGGYSFVNTDLPTEADKQGYQLQFKLGPTYSWKKASIDLGLGFFYNRMFGSSGAVDRDDITTWAWFAEVVPKYRISDAWSVGPSLTYYFGTDLSFASSVKGDSGAVFAGLQGAYQFAVSEKLHLRALAQFSTDLSVSDRQVYVGMLGLQLGIPLKLIAPKLVLKSDPNSDIQVKVEEASELAKSGPVLKGSGASSFALGSSELTLEARQALVRFGEALAMKPEEWDKVVVEGHTDRTELNVEVDVLSQRRADAVARALSAAGIDPNRIETFGFGASRPLDTSDTPEAHRKNRRVEIRVLGSREKKPVSGVPR